MNLPESKYCAGVSHAVINVKERPCPDAPFAGNVLCVDVIKAEGRVCLLIESQAYGPL